MRVSRNIYTSRQDFIFHPTTADATIRTALD